jgi:diguanylate cyclase (GGDEF)-like protein
MSPSIAPRTWLAGPRSRVGCALFAAAALLLTASFAMLATPKPAPAWQLLDLFGEGSLALLAAAWCVVVLDSRPGGSVTRLLGGGLAALALAAWADALDEIFSLPAATAWLGALESLLMPAGIVALGIGLVLWRQEQFVLGEQLGGRERGERDHRRFDRLTRLADAAYLRQQMAAEAARPAPSTVAMFEIGSMLQVQRCQGERAAARLLQSAAQQLLVNLRPDDLLCRYAGDRLVVLMPETAGDEGLARAAHLRRMIAAMRVHVAGQREPLTVDVACACAPCGSDVQATLSALGRELEPMRPQAAAA